MSKNLLIVESPAKASTINKYLGKDFIVLASYGHVRDLVPKEGAVDTEANFEMKYRTIERNEKHVSAIVKAMKKAEALYLATDLDREGEAISWHLLKLLEEKGILKNKPVFRVVFSEITKRAIQNAIENPRELSMDLVNAQQARRALDYLVGFNLSPLLWKKVRRGLSAGRVQSPALRLIVEREEEIEAFKPQEYWTLEADSSKDDQAFVAKLRTLEGKRLKQFDINNTEQANNVRQMLLDAASGKLSVDNVEKKQRKRNPAPPFITSTLQQEASRRLRFGAQKTMRNAQQLYEKGLITYMRTDSVALSQDALQDLRAVIAARYGKDQLPEKPNFFRSKQKNAQEAHEAIRPAEPGRAPEHLKGDLNADQLKLYELIWRRTVACQMRHALMHTVSVDLGCGEGNQFRASGSTVKEPGFLKVYEESVESKRSDNQENRLPPMEKGDTVTLTKLRAEQHFTEPPPRYSEASLVKVLEEYGIGRPSTYASIIQTLINREYVELDKRRLIPTDVGKVVSKFLSKHFTQYVDYEFTAELEDELDEVSRGEKDWVPVLKTFWKPFIDQVHEKEETVSRDEARQARVLGTDPESGKEVSARLGRYGPYVQIGTRDDEDKPKFAGLKPGQKLDTITYEEAMKLFDLPRDLGETPEGEPVSANIGRFGPYVRYGSKFVSIKDGDPYEITLPEALKLIAEKKEADANRIIQSFDDGRIQVLRGRWGPYITDGNKNGKIPKDVEPEKLTLEECEKILAEAPERKGRRGKKKVSKKRTSKKKTATKKTTKKKKKTAKKSTRKKAGKKATAKA